MVGRTDTTTHRTLNIDMLAGVQTANRLLMKSGRVRLEVSSTLSQRAHTDLPPSSCMNLNNKCQSTEGVRVCVCCVCCVAGRKKTHVKTRCICTYHANPALGIIASSLIPRNERVELAPMCFAVCEGRCHRRPAQAELTSECNISRWFAPTRWRFRCNR